jgi:glycosyltransferase involved in cell wall biosynthesis
MTTKPRLLRITTVPISLKILLRGQLSFFQKKGFEVLTASDDGPEVQQLIEDGIPHCVVPMTRKITPARDLISLFKLILLIRRFKPDIVHTHTPKAGLLGMMASRICRIPVRIHTVAGLPLMERSGLVKRILIATEKITYSCATGVFSNSEGLRSYIHSVIRPKTTVRVLGKGSSNGIDLNYFSSSSYLHEQALILRNKYSISSNDTVFCFVGRIVRDKGINELVDAFDRLSKKISAKLILVGPFEDNLDPIAPAARQLINDHPGIISLGYVQDVRPALAASDIFVFPSYREGFPNVVMQACALELPAIATDINGCNEIVKNGITGLLVKPKNVSALFESMDHLASDKMQRIRMGKAGRCYVEDNFDQQKIWNELHGIYTSFGVG